MKSRNIGTGKTPGNPAHKICLHCKNSSRACQEDWHGLSSSLFLDTLAGYRSQLNFGQLPMQLHIAPLIVYDGINSHLHMLGRGTSLAWRILSIKEKCFQRSHVFLHYRMNPF